MKTILCGVKLPVDPAEYLTPSIEARGLVTCQACGTVFDCDGWIIRRGKAVRS